MQKIGIRLNDDVYKRLSEIADRYGMTKNSLISYILGQWIDNNYDLKDRIQKAVENLLGCSISSDVLEQAIKNALMSINKEV